MEVQGTKLHHTVIQVGLIVEDGQGLFPNALCTSVLEIPTSLFWNLFLETKIALENRSSLGNCRFTFATPCRAELKKAREIQTDADQRQLLEGQ
jgi:hypothetical protein